VPSLEPEDRLPAAANQKNGQVLKQIAPELTAAQASATTLRAGRLGGAVSLARQAAGGGHLVSPRHLQKQLRVTRARARHPRSGHRAGGHHDLPGVTQCGRVGGVGVVDGTAVDQRTGQGERGLRVWRPPASILLKAAIVRHSGRTSGHSHRTRIPLLTSDSRVVNWACKHVWTDELSSEAPLRWRERHVAQETAERRPRKQD
jgi:hypothetical protein